MCIYAGVHMHTYAYLMNMSPCLGRKYLTKILLFPQANGVLKGEKRKVFEDVCNGT